MFEKEISEDLENYYKTIENSEVLKVIKYSVREGKCLRGFLVKHLIRKLSDSEINIWQPIVSVELLHTASLIIDDLPCMDNDEERRGKLSTFKVFGERKAILSSFYLVSNAFKLLHNSFRIIELELGKKNGNKLSLDEHLKKINELWDYWNDLIGNSLIVGQLLDLREDVEKLLNIKMPKSNQEELVMIYKTSSLFSFSFVLGGLFSLNQDIDLEDFKKMGYHMGIMYQIMDDYKDKYDKDISNYLIMNGPEKSKMMYKVHKQHLLELLENNNIKTDELLMIIEMIDGKITNSKN